jgi:hypothetical protein
MCEQPGSDPPTCPAYDWPQTPTVFTFVVVER